MDMTADQRRARAPWLDYDVPEDQQIVRFGGSGPQMSMGDGGKLTPPPGITAYHGSPHDFDRFDMSKIGTGEGAQAYGHGLYFAEAEGVAKQYRDNVSAQHRSDPVWQGKRVKEYDYDGNVVFEDGTTTRLADGQQQAFHDALNSPRTPGRMYEVRINAEPADFLDWDKPISQQSEKARTALIETMKQKANRQGDIDWHAEKWANTADYPDLQTPLTMLRDRAGPEGARALADSGIPGIRYLDQGSRTAGEGSRNYVVFRDDIIDIVKKYGVAFATSLFGLEQVMQSTNPQNALATEPQ